MIKYLDWYGDGTVCKSSFGDIVASIPSETVTAKSETTIILTKEYYDNMVNTINEQKEEIEQLKENIDNLKQTLKIILQQG